MTKRLTAFLAITIQLLGLWFIIDRYELLREYHFDRAMPYVVGAFVVSAWIRPGYRPALFALLGMVVAIAVHGWSDGMALLGISMVLILVAMAGWSPWTKIIVIGLIGLVLVGVKARWFDQIPEASVLTAVGGIFMFRIISFLHYRKQGVRGKTFWSDIGYFLMTPNVAVYLFPIVDYKEFVKVRAQQEDYDIYHRGIRLMALGTFQIVLYRFIYFYLLPHPDDINTLPQFASYLIFTYTLVLKIVGLFHLSLGMVAMFGFDLPRLFNWFFFARGFSDLWRRINIYWKDFVTKVFYYPIYFKLKRLGMGGAIVASTFIVLFVTWLLHSWQFFWRHGLMPIQARDAVFWGVFAVMLSVSALHQLRPKRSSPVSSIRRSLTNALQVLFMFCAMTILWNYWVSTPEEWDELLALATAEGLLVFLVGVLVVFGLLVVGSMVLSKYPLGTWLSGQHVMLRWIVAAWILGATLFGWERINLRQQSSFKSLIHFQLNERDLERMRKGYYEEMTSHTDLMSELPVAVDERPDEWRNLTRQGILKPTNSVLIREMQPNKSGVHMGVPFETNRWSMRDKDYELKKPGNTYRICLLGSSYEMGHGVRYEEGFEYLIEERLNRELSPETGVNYEVLNFSAGGYKSLQLLYLLGERVIDFEPDALLYFSHRGIANYMMGREVADVLHHGNDLYFDFVKNMVKEAGLTVSSDQSLAKRKLVPYERELLLWSYDLILDTCKSHNIEPVWVYLPSLEEIDAIRETVREHLEIAMREGFNTIMLEGVYGNGTMEELQVAEWDTHPNAEGHRRIADMLYHKLMDLDSVLHFATPKQAVGK